MAFKINEAQQFRLNISFEAKATLESDRKSFKEILKINTSEEEYKEVPLSSFVNQILENYYESSAASISIQLDKYEDSICNIFSKTNKKITQKELEILRNTREKELLIQLNQENKSSIHLGPYRLRNTLFTFLTDKNQGSNDEKYFDYSANKYLSSIIEDYSMLPFIERERIYFKNIFDDIERAINEEIQIMITKKSKTFFVLPYKIMTNNLSTYSYLVGYAYESTESKENMKPCSFRISELTSEIYRLVKSKSAFLSQKRKENLHKQIALKGVEYLISDLIKITVKFTPKGLENFYRQINRRPNPEEPITTHTHPYTFICSETQARYYFTQFGKNAEILSPPSLRKEFKEKYHEACALYETSPS